MIGPDNRRSPSAIVPADCRIEERHACIRALIAAGDGLKTGEEPMRFVHAAHLNRGQVESESEHFLQIRRGRTQFPQRPLSSDRIAIGGGTTCHLQLGGGMPMVHSLLTREGKDWRLEAIAPEPPLIVNGSVVRSHRLRTNDVVELGPFQFVMCRREAQQVIAGRKARVGGAFQRAMVTP